LKITNIEIKNFRAFPKTYQIKLHNAGKNLLVYGENGSGKSSLYLALKYFFESGVNEDKEEGKNTEFENHQNIFTEDPGHIKLRFRSDQPQKQEIYKWSKDVKETNNNLIIEISKASGFLDYKDLLGVHYLQPEGESVNVFDLLVETLLANTVNPVTDRTLAEAWDDIQEPYPRRSAKHQIASLEQRVEVFNDELVNRLADLRPKVREILRRFGYKVDLNLNLDPKGVRYNRENKSLENQQILLNVKFFDKDISERYLLLNEAKLSAIAIAIYFSSILCLPEPKGGMKILALDDVLIGLDMPNRLPVLDILNDYFADYQIFLTTYDKAWYEIVKQRTDQKDWKYTEFYSKATDEHEIPVYVEDKAYLDKAKEYFDVNDYKACAIYVRTAFEATIKQYCEKKDLCIKYRENPKELRSEDFWVPIKMERDEAGLLLLDLRVVDEIELYRSIILNPLSHAAIANIYRKELEDVINAVEELETALANV
jgi:energy-coupling factor transporter ATP-binding protein EcfA2